MRYGCHSYEIRVGGRLFPDWAEWLDRAELRVEGRETVILLRDADEAAIYGAFRLLERMRCPLVGVRIADGDEGGTPAMNGESQPVEGGEKDGTGTDRA